MDHDFLLFIWVLEAFSLGYLSDRLKVLISSLPNGHVLTSIFFLDNRIIETHYKSAIVLASFAVTVIGWMAPWQSFLAGIYTEQPSPYDVRDGFFDTFGRDPGWWLSLIGVLVVLFIIEMGYKMARRMMLTSGLWRWSRDWWKRGKWWGKKRSDWMENNLEDWDLGLWQGMEQDEEVKKKLRGILEAEEAGFVAADVAVEERSDSEDLHSA